ncbi:hypothetical protein HK099_007829 [Clydaea vesicula]|uniref:Uncharacterized protein n=1 Tax=Clydaea vesicula TaxID=447962 RepID=A0AAD5XZ77_9FUNG|nr:hypothetical protein HK099_007829 [Clydaea vesicula]
MFIDLISIGLTVAIKVCSVNGSKFIEMFISNTLSLHVNVCLFLFKKVSIGIKKLKKQKNVITEGVEWISINKCISLKENERCWDPNDKCENTINRNSGIANGTEIGLQREKTVTNKHLPQYEIPCSNLVNEL